MIDRVYVTNDLSYINRVNDSSIIYSINNNAGTWNVMSHGYGKINIISVNMSHNKCSYVSGIWCEPYSSTSSTDPPCLISFSTFTDNTAHTNYYCLQFGNSGACKEIRTSNILRNRQASSSGGIIYSNGNLNIINSCILDNDKEHNLLYAKSNTITVKNCTIEDNVKTYGSVKITDKTSKSFINALIHISTQNCHDEFDSAGGLTAPKLSTSKSRRLHNTFYRRPKIDMLGFLLYIFLVSHI